MMFGVRSVAVARLVGLSRCRCFRLGGGWRLRSWIGGWVCSGRVAVAVVLMLGGSLVLRRCLVLPMMMTMMMRV